MSNPSFTQLDAHLVGCACLGDEAHVQHLLDQGAEPSLTVQRVHDGRAVKVPLALSLVMAQFDPQNEGKDLSAYSAISRLLIDRTRLIQPSAFVLAGVFEQKRGEGPAMQVVRFVDPQTPTETEAVTLHDKRVFEALFRLVPRAYQEEVREPVIVDELAARRNARRRSP